jgi:RNA polymerase sigma factor (sigma-70 family)
MRLDELPDPELVARVPAPDAVRALYERHVHAVLRFAIRRCRDPEDVADLVSSVFVELFAAAPGYDRRYENARPWLLGIATRCLADMRRGQHRRDDLTRRLGARPAFDDEEYERVEQMLDAERLGEHVERGVAERLTDAERELFLLVAADGLTPAEAARCVGLTAVAARMRLSRARRKLRAHLHERVAPNPQKGEVYR